MSRRKVLPVVFLLFFLLVFLNSVFAAIAVSLPVEAELSNKDELELGNVARGEILEVVIQKNSREGFNWDSVVVNAPATWVVDSKLGDKTIEVDLSIPQNAPESIQVITFSLSSSQNPVAEESFKGILAVKKNLLTVSMDNLKQETIVGKTIFFKAVLNNDSSAKHKVLVSSSLPNYWFQPIEVTLKPKEKQELTLPLTPKAYGLRNFSFFIKSGQNDFSKEFVSELKISPTLAWKFLASAYAFPFFTMSNLPFYLANSLFAMPFSGYS